MSHEGIAKLLHAKTCVCGPRLRFCGVRANLCAQTGFFKQPCLHFPLADTYVQGGALLEEPGEKEDDPNGTPDAEPAELTAMGAQDAADAEAVLNQLMRNGANVAPPTGGEEGSSAEFFEEIRKLLADFNVSIQEESKDRKLRFHVKRLIKSHQQRGEDVDEELDFYMDDDDGDHALAACHTHT